VRHAGVGAVRPAACAQARSFAASHATHVLCIFVGVCGCAPGVAAHESSTAADATTLDAATSAVESNSSGHSETSSSGDATTASQEPGTTSSETGERLNCTSISWEECPEPQADVEGWECNPWADDCPAGMKCWFRDAEPALCVNLTRRTAALYDACTLFDSAEESAPRDDCGSGLACVGGLCLGLGSCSEAHPICEDPDADVILIGQQPSIECFPRCDPLDVDSCFPEWVCTDIGVGFHCLAPHATVGSGSPCAYLSDCEAGTVCVTPPPSFCAAGDAGCCVPVCSEGDGRCDRLDAECVLFEREQPSCWGSYGLCRE
jgi:hypothetical protein